jgi:hypothetical protein
MSLLRLSLRGGTTKQSRIKLVLLSILFAASPRNDVASDGGIVVGTVACDCGYVVGGVVFEAVRMHGRPGEHRHCEVARVRLSCTSYLNRSNLLEKGNPAKKGFGEGGIVLSRVVLAYMRLLRRSRTRACASMVYCNGFASQ